MEPGRSLTRRQFDEVIRRAAELTSSEPESHDGELTEEELFRIAGEVGLPEHHVRRALVEVRNAAPPTGPLDSVFGPAFVRSSRVVPQPREALVRALDDFLVAGQLLQNVRTSGSGLLYRPAVDWASQIARAASATSRRYYVAAAKRVEVRLEELGPSSTLVAIEVEPGTRNEYVAGGVLGGGGTAVGLALGLGFAVATVAPPAVAVLLGLTVGGAGGAGVAWLAGRAHRRRLADVREEVEGILDRLEAGESLEPPPPSWRRWVRRHFHGVAREVLGRDA